MQREQELKLAREIMLHVNRRLRLTQAISEQTYRRAEERIMKISGRDAHGFIRRP
ncbi:MAG: hypothetical protein GX572_06170 [Clostridia bacterium]|nr:hypothetical protein [Clostridia bacterium]